MTELKEYRCTRKSLYQHDCSGRLDVRQRQGHYIIAQSETEAKNIMREEFPEDRYGFTAQFIKVIGRKSE